MIVTNTGENIPELVLIDHLHLDEINDAEIKRIANADWFIAFLNQGYGDSDDEQPTPYLMANADQLGSIVDIDSVTSYYFIHADGTVSEDLGGILVEVLAVNDVLKRWSSEDGFYTV